MGQGVPVDPVVGAVLQRVAEVVVEVQNVHPKRVGNIPTEEVCLDDIMAGLRSLVFNLGSKQGNKAGELGQVWTGLPVGLWDQEATSHPLSKRHGEVPYD